MPAHHPQSLRLAPPPDNSRSLPRETPQPLYPRSPRTSSQPQRASQAHDNTPTLRAPAPRGNPQSRPRARDGAQSLLLPRGVDYAQPSESYALDRAEPPRFGDTLRQLRVSRRISRESLAVTSGVSVSYLSHLERGRRDRPGAAVLAALLASLDRVRLVSPAERRLCFDLAGVSMNGAPSPRQLREAISGAAHRRMMRREGLSAYIDARLHVLACNATFAAAHPGVLESRSLLHWYLETDRSKESIGNRDEALALLMGWLRGMAGALHRPDAFVDLLADLGRFPEFERGWAEAEPFYFEDPKMLRLRDSGTGVESIVSIQAFGVGSVRFPGWIRYLDGGPADPRDTR
ncbi:helix-turn-helix domain-containing protein [Nocardia sp. NPDC058058]|uniref:helix-turn-helix domain-containing protein n=1 Tax=Nocardia sp. NPDC058058 TaxID=3346317 RepID=UPI0036DC1626